MKKIRIGSGAGFAGDRIEPAIELIKYGNLDYIIFECLAERTIALAQKRKKENIKKGYDHLLEYRMERIIPLLQKYPTKIITNMGAANPYEAAKKTSEICKANKLDKKIAYVLGDDVVENLDEYQFKLTLESKTSLAELNGEIISANAYIGAKSITDALEAGADIVITGRVSDPSLTVGPLIHEFNESYTNINFLAQASVAGHLLECGAQVTGGYFATNMKKKVPNLAEVGFPIVEFQNDGVFTVEKLDKSGGLLNLATVKEQLVYEIHDPSSYFTPDVIVDFTNVEVEKKKQKIQISGISGKAKNRTLKTSIGYEGGFIAEGEISYGGSKSYELAKLASDVIDERIKRIGLEFLDSRTDYIGLNSLYHLEISSEKMGLDEIRLRKAYLFEKLDQAEIYTREFDSLYTNGPAAGGGIRTRINNIIAIESILIDEQDIQTKYYFV